MKLTKEQWEFIRKRISKEPGGGRRRHDAKRVIEGILWILKTGARWCDLPKEYPSYQTCHRRFQEWWREGVIRDILEDLVRHLQKKGKINLAETLINATFVEAKKGVKKSAPRNAEGASKSWQLRTIQVFLSSYPLQVLHLHWSRPDLTTSAPRELFFKQPTELSADSNLFHSPDNGLQEMSA